MGSTFFRLAVKNIRHTVVGFNSRSFEILDQFDEDFSSDRHLWLSKPKGTAGVILPPILVLLARIPPVQRRTSN